MTTLADSAPPTAWVIMPFINNAGLTVDAAQDVLDQSVRTTLLLVDNGSSDRTAFNVVQEWALTKNVRDRVLMWSYPTGFPSLAGIWNRALQFAWSAGADRAWVVNNDVRLHPRTLEVLSGVMDYGTAWFVTANSVRSDGWALFQKQLREVNDIGAAAVDDYILSIIGDPPRHSGPDFSCFLISRECHKWFQFDERFAPAYHEDNDYHRRLELAGLGDRIFGVNFPFLHFGSGTVNAMEPAARTRFHDKFHACQQYYVEKWGGLPHHETYLHPFNAAGGRTLLLGQGRPGVTLEDGVDRPDWL